MMSPGWHLHSRQIVHDKLDTTMQYVVLDKSDVKNSYRKYA